MAVAMDTRTSAGRRTAQVVERALATLQGAIAHARADEVSGPEAVRLVESLARIEHLAATGKAIFARRVERTGVARQEGFRDASSWLAHVSGKPVGSAREELATAQKVERLPAVRDALLAGEISPHAAKQLTKVAEFDRGAVPGLLDVARNGSHGDLRRHAERVRQRARSEESEEAAEARVHRSRFCRISSDDNGGVRLEALLSRRAGAQLKAALEHEMEVLFGQLPPGVLAEHAHLAADALVQLVCGHGAGGAARNKADIGMSGPSTHVVLRADVGALLRGAPQGDEVCEIAGLGRVSVRLARQLLGDSLFTVVCRSGKDIKTVTSTSRTIPGAIRAALFERDRVCCVPGCNADRFLEIDHWQTDYALGGETCLDNLARLCPAHHALKTNTGWRLLGGPGRWEWRRPLPGFKRPRRPEIRRRP